jgi:hypothetical protein
MKNRFLVASSLLLAAALTANAAYIVVLKNGTRYRARTKWTIQNGKATIPLENGTILQLDPALIDVAASETASKSGLGDAKLLAVSGGPTTPAPSTQAAGSSLGQLSRTRGNRATPGSASQASPAPAAAQPPVSQAASRRSEEFISKLQQAYENVGIFEYKVVAAEGNGVRAELVADSEDQVFKAISATAFVVANVSLADGVKVEPLELFMKTVRGGSAGRFQMTQAEATAIASKKKTWQSYYVERVLF